MCQDTFPGQSRLADKVPRMWLCLKHFGPTLQHMRNFRPPIRSQVWLLCRACSVSLHTHRWFHWWDTMRQAQPSVERLILQPLVPRWGNLWLRTREYTNNQHQLCAVPSSSLIITPFLIPLTGASEVPLWQRLIFLGGKGVLAKAKLFSSQSMLHSGLLLSKPLNLLLWVCQQDPLPCSKSHQRQPLPPLPPPLPQEFALLECPSCLNVPIRTSSQIQ